MLDENSQTFITHVISLVLISVHLDRKTQIASLLTKKVKISDKYPDFIDDFLEKIVLVLPERTKLNKHTMNLEKDKQPSYELIYSLELIKLETLKTYIEIHLKTGFIQPFKSSTSALILFDKKSNGSFHLCIDYRGFNNFTIKN